MISSRFRRSTPIWLCLAFLAGCGARSETVAEAQPPPIARGAARVWVFREADARGVNVDPTAPMVFANGTSFAASAAGTVFFRDVAPGTYRFTTVVDGPAAPAAETLQLAPGMETYLQVTAAPNPRFGAAAGGDFAVLATSPAVARRSLSKLAYLGER
jgi:hypothetical protein